MGPREAPRSAEWRRVALVCGALLVLPIVGWAVLAPRAVTPTAKRAEPAEARETTAPTQAPIAARTPSHAKRERPVEVVPQAASPSGSGIEGEVIGADDKPVPQASIKCALADRDLEASSDQAGRFHLPADADGCTATASKRGFAPSSGVAMHLGGGNRLTLTPGAGIAGVVVDGSGAPVVGYWIGVESRESVGAAASPDAGAIPRPEAIEVNDASGAFALEDLAPGRYVLAASVPSYPVARTAPIEVSAGVVTKDVKIVLKPGGTVIGKVLDASTGKPISGAMVFAEAVIKSGLRSSTAVSEGSGEFTFQGGCPEGCALRVLHPLYKVQVTPDIRAADGAPPVHVEVKLEPLVKPAEKP
jgi:hypothetical protein